MGKPRRAAFPCRLHSAKWKWPPSTTIFESLYLLFLFSVGHTRISWEDHEIARRGIDLFRWKHHASLPIDPTLPRTLFSSIEESLVDRFLVGSREINSGEGGSSVKGRFFGNWFSSVGLGDCFGFGRKFRGEREKFLCWFRFRECFLSQTDRKIWFQDFVFEYGIRSNILFKSNGG